MRTFYKHFHVRGQKIKSVLKKLSNEWLQWEMLNTNSYMVATYTDFGTIRCRRCILHTATVTHNERQNCYHETDLPWLKLRHAWSQSQGWWMKTRHLLMTTRRKRLHSCWHMLYWNNITQLNSTNLCWRAQTIQYKINLELGTKMFLNSSFKWLGNYWKSSSNPRKIYARRHIN